jgi:hypothetical protein
MKRKEEANKMRDFEVVNARSWKDKNGKEVVFFTMRLEVNGLDIVFYDLTVQEGKKCSVGRGVIYRAANYHTVSGIQFFSYLVYQIIKDTAMGLVAASAADTTPDQGRANLNDFRFNSVILEDFLHLLECKGSVAFFVGTAVE